jgi:hypothetical protein
MLLRIALCFVVLLSVGAAARRPVSIDPAPVISLTTHAAAASAAHAVSFAVAAGDPEIYRAGISYPAGFQVRGFDRVGPVGSPVGSFELDVNGDGAADRVLPFRSLSGTTAYVDVVPDGGFSPDIEPSVTVSGNTLDVRVPAGGDANVATRVAPFGCRVALVLFPQLIVNPAIGGDYPIVARLTTVDPDTDGADDGAGTPPETSRSSSVVHIDGPALVAFSSLRIDRLDLKLNGANRDRVTISGRFLLGAGGVINRRTDDVSVSFASFSQTIPAAAFAGSGPIREYKDKGKGPGVEKMKLGADGQFDIDLRDLHLIIPARQQTVSLRIGNNFGSAVVSVPVLPGRDDKPRK